MLIGDEFDLALILSSERDLGGGDCWHGKTVEMR